MKELTKELDHLKHKVEATKNQPTEARNHLECKLHRLSSVPHPSALPEPLDEVLQQYTKLYALHKREPLLEAPCFNITIFNGNDSSQLEDWLINIGTTANLTSESRTKLAQA